MRLTTLVVTILVSACFFSGSAAHAQRSAYGDSEYRLGPEDVIEVFVYKETELSATVVVRPDGKVSLPLIGELPASGKTAVELQKEVGQKLAQYISEPVVNVIVKETNSAKVSVLGEVRTPGMYKIKDRATLLDVIAMAGGFTEYANRGKILVIRTGASGEQSSIKIKMDDQIKGSKGGGPFYVQPYDKVYIQ